MNKRVFQDGPQESHDLRDTLLTNPPNICVKTLLQKKIPHRLQYLPTENKFI